MNFRFGLSASRSLLTTRRAALLAFLTITETSNEPFRCWYGPRSDRCHSRLSCSFSFTHFCLLCAFFSSSSKSLLKHSTCRPAVHLSTGLVILLSSRSTLLQLQAVPRRRSPVCSLAPCAMNRMGRVFTALPISLALLPSFSAAVLTLYHFIPFILAI